MNLRFASWNVNGRKFTMEHNAFIKDMGLDVIALQEARPQFHSALADTQLFSWGRSSLQINPPESGAPRSRLLGCSIFGTPALTPKGSKILHSVYFPERTLLVEADTGMGSAVFASFHIPPGASWKLIKPQTMVTIAKHLSELRRGVIVGMDANSPKTDHPDPGQNTWWWQDEPQLLGQSAAHHLKDALRVHLGNHPQRAAEVRFARPGGPLAVSHIRGRGLKKTECRYDFVLVSPDLQVINVEYYYEQSVKAGSDHAMVVADLEFNIS